MRYELTDHEFAAIKPMLPNKPRGGLRSGAPWRDLRENYVPAPATIASFGGGGLVL